jgi:hypothetical protein
MDTTSYDIKDYVLMKDNAKKCTPESRIILKMLFFNYFCSEDYYERNGHSSGFGGQYII